MRTAQLCAFRRAGTLVADGCPLGSTAAGAPIEHRKNVSSRTHCIGRPKLHATDLETLVFGEAEGRVTDEELAMLRADPAAWASTLRRLIAETEAALSSVSRKKGAEEEQAQADLSQERQLLSAALRRLEGDDAPAEPPTDVAPSRPARTKRAAGSAPAPAPPGGRSDLSAAA